jgi:hypothetical protein
MALAASAEWGESLVDWSPPCLSSIFCLSGVVRERIDEVGQHNALRGMPQEALNTTRETRRQVTENLASGEGWQFSGVHLWINSSSQSKPRTIHNRAGAKLSKEWGLVFAGQRTVAGAAH